MAKLKDGFYKLTASSMGSNLHVLLAGGGAKPISDFALAFNVKLWGLDFDGSSDVSGKLTGVTQILNKENKGIYLWSNTYSSAIPTNSGNLGTGVGIGLSPLFGTFIWGKGDGNGHILVGRSDGTNISYNLLLQEFGGNVGIGTTSPSYKLDVSGTIKASSHLITNARVKILDGLALEWNDTAANGSTSNLLLPRKNLDYRLDYYDGTNWHLLAYKTDIPTKTSQLINDSGYVTGGPYLPLSGGTLTSSSVPLYLDRTDSNSYTLIGYRNTSKDLGYLGFSNYGDLVVSPNRQNGNTNYYAIWHSGNFNPSDYLPLTGGTLTGTLTVNSDLGVGGLIVNRGHYLFARDNANADWIVTNKNWLDEYKLWHSGNDGSGSGLDADLLDGQEGSWYIRNVLTFQSNDGDGVKGGKDLNSLTYGIVSNYGSSNFWANAPTGMKYGMVLNLKTSSSNDLMGQLAWDINHRGTDSTRYLYWRANDDRNFATAKWHQIAFTDSNVASATKLQTARTIWGRSFDGTSDISGSLYITNNNAIYIKDTSDNWLNQIEVSSGNAFNIGYSSGGRGYSTLLYGGDITLKVGTSRVTSLYIDSNRNGEYNGMFTFKRASQIPLYISNTDSSLTDVCARFVVNNAYKASIGTNSGDYLLRYNADLSKSYVIWDSGNDGSGSGLDADLLDGKHDGEVTAQYFSPGKLLTSSDTINKLMSGVYCYINGDNPTGSVDDNVVLLSFRNTGRTDMIQFVGAANTSNLYYRRAANIGNQYENWTSWKTIAFTDSNVASATQVMINYSYNQDINYPLVFTSRDNIGVAKNGDLYIDFSGRPTYNPKSNTLTVGNINMTGSINSVLKATTSLGAAMLNIAEVTADINYIHLYVSSLNSTYATTRPLVLQNGYGNVGIGTTSPSERLHVNGTGRVDNIHLKSTYINLNRNGSNSAIYDSTKTALEIEATTDLSILRTYNVTTQASIVLHTNGNIGIGTLTPSAKLHSHGLVKITANSRTLTIGSQNADHCHYSTDSPCHWFNKEVRVVGHVYGGTNYDRRLAYADELLPLTTITKTIQPTTSWSDTGIISSNIGGDGVFILYLVPNHSNGNDGWLPTYAGLFVNYTGTNGNETEEIILQAASHASYKRLFLRFINTANTIGHRKLLIKAESNYTTSYSMKFYFRRII